MTAASSSGPSTGWASGTTSVAASLTRRRVGVACAARPPRRARLLGVGQRVDERLPRGGDDVLVDADRAPDVVAVGGVDEHARGRAGAVVLVEDADLVVDELDVLEVRVDLADRVAQRGVERVDRAVALGRADVALAVDPDLDRRLGLDLAVGALLDDHAPGLQAEERLVVAGLAAQQQLEGAVGGLELVAAVLERLDAVDDALRRRRRRGRARRPRPSRPTVWRPASSETSSSRGCRPAPGRRARRSRVGAHAGDVQAALVGEGVAPDVGLGAVGRAVEQLVDEVRGLGEARELLVGRARGGPSSAAGWR